MAFPNMAFGSPPKHLVNDATRGPRIGQRMYYADGRRWTYCLVGATTLISGDLLTGKAVVSGDYTDLVTDVAPVIGDTQLSITTTVSTAAAYYDGGWAHCNLATTLLQGQSYRLKETGANVLNTSGPADIFKLDPIDPIRVAGTTATEFGFVPDEYNGVIIAGTTVAARVIGVAQAPITNAQFGYIQTWGMSCVQTAGTEVVGNNSVAITAAAGRAGLAVSPGLLPVIGYNLSVPSADGQEGAIFLTIE